MSVSIHKVLLEKSVASMISAIEIYNKPDFKFREETFAVLSLNSWELLLKSKLLKESNHRMQCLYIKKYINNKRGEKSNRWKWELNRSGSYKTIDLFNCLKRLSEEFNINIDEKCKANINLLSEVRDNSTHFYNKPKHLNKKIMEIGNASLRNYLAIIKDWFNYSLDKYNFYLMPISFFHEFETIESFSINKLTNQEKLFVEYINQQERRFPSNPSNDYNISIQVHTKFVKSESIDALLVRTTNDPSAPALRLTEENMLDRYPMTYYELISKLKERYSDFRETQDFHKKKKQLETNKKFVWHRLLDPHNPNSSKKKFYSYNIFQEFDKYYEKVK